MNPISSHIIAARRFSCDSCWQPLLQATLWGELTKACLLQRNDGKATSGLTNLLLISLRKPTVLHLSISPLVYCTYLCNCFAVTSFNFYHSISSVCPVTSFSLAAVHQRLHASQLSAQTTACCPAVYWCFWVSIHCSHRSRDEEKIIQLENYFPFFPVRFLPSTLSRDTLIRYVFARP